MNPKVDFYFTKAKTWQKEIEQLRTIVLDCDLTETLKWGCPCYTYEDSNVVLIHTFKEYCALLFFKGALLKDPKEILIQQTENVQAARQMRFTSLQEITKLKTTIKAYIKGAIAAEKSGLKVELKKTSEFSMPDEFKQVLKEDAALKKAFNALTPGRQRGYLLHFSSAKQSKTREARIEKCIPDIMEGKGLND
jgi:uncharacterized protein YdeI (YjbR/CyaY-like superfamily)